MLCLAVLFLFVAVQAIYLKGTLTIFNSVFQTSFDNGVVFMRKTKRKNSVLKLH